jgi:hypothetical protein
MKIKIDAGYRSVETSEGAGNMLQVKNQALPYVKADIDIDVDFLKYINSRFGESNTAEYDALMSALKHTFSQIARGVQVF